MTPHWRCTHYKGAFIVCAVFMRGSEVVRYPSARPWAENNTTICDRIIRHIDELPGAVAKISADLERHRARLDG